MDHGSPNGSTALITVEAMENEKQLDAALKAAFQAGHFCGSIETLNKCAKRNKQSVDTAFLLGQCAGYERGLKVAISNRKSATVVGILLLALMLLAGFAMGWGTR